MQHGEAFHFIAYVPVGGALYELDGLKPGPIQLAVLEEGVGGAQLQLRPVGEGLRSRRALTRVCTPSQGDWLDAVVPAIQERMARYAASEIKFNLMAIVGDRRATLTEKVCAQCACVRARGAVACAARCVHCVHCGRPAAAEAPALAPATPPLPCRLPPRRSSEMPFWQTLPNSNRRPARAC